jgi:glycosyltransferase involved in cell wall biosynthesis
LVGAVDDVAPYIRAADLFVLPSAAEGLSNALLEGLASGLPAVATAVGGNPDLIESDDNGLLVPVDDAPALSAAIRALLAAPERRARLGQRARERVRAEFDITIAVDRLEALYRRLAAAPADRPDPNDLRDLPAVLPAIEQGARRAHAGQADE